MPHTATIKSLPAEFRMLKLMRGSNGATTIAPPLAERSASSSRGGMGAADRPASRAYGQSRPSQPAQRLLSAPPLRARAVHSQGRQRAPAGARPAGRSSHLEPDVQASPVLVLDGMVLKRKIGAGARSSPAPMLRRQRLTFAADLTSGKTMCTNTTAVTVTGSWTIYPWGWQFTRSEGLDEAYVPSFGTLGAAWDDAMGARWSATCSRCCGRRRTLRWCRPAGCHRLRRGAR